jgi:SAM-dependent methyltransferase
LRAFCVMARGRAKRQSLLADLLGRYNWRGNFRQELPTAYRLLRTANHMSTHVEAAQQAESLERFVAAGHHREAIYGLQWGDPRISPPLARVKDEFLLPALGPAITVLEIGCGGGRWSRYFHGRVKKAFLADATPAAEIAVRAHTDWDGFEFLMSVGGRLTGLADASIDYVFSFDTFVHFHRELFDGYVREIGRVLKPGGLLHLHHAARWPEAEINERSFQYRDARDIEALCSSAALRLTNRLIEFRGGYGSVLREAVQLLRGPHD